MNRPTATRRKAGEKVEQPALKGTGIVQIPKYKSPWAKTKNRKTK